MDQTNEAIECGHCGEKNRMRVVGKGNDTEVYEQEGAQPFEAGTLYEVVICPRCKKPTLLWGDWHEYLDSSDEPWQPGHWLPDQRARHASQILERHEADWKFMRLAVEEARRARTEPGQIKPMVGAVAARRSSLLKSAYRGQGELGHHAEYRLLEYECKAETLKGATVYTTLEPCTKRNPPKIPCVERLIARKVARVVIGMLDPDENIRGKGVLILRQHNIQVDLFPPDLMAELEELNRDFIKEKASPLQEGVLPGPGTTIRRPAIFSEVSDFAALLEKIPVSQRKLIKLCHGFMTDGLYPRQCESMISLIDVNADLNTMTFSMTEGSYPNVAIPISAVSHVWQNENNWIISIKGSLVKFSNQASLSYHG